MNYQTGPEGDSLRAIEAYDRILRSARVLLLMGRWEEERFREVASQAHFGKATELRLLGNDLEADICTELGRESLPAHPREGGSQ